MREEIMNRYDQHLREHHQSTSDYIRAKRFERRTMMTGIAFTGMSIPHRARAAQALAVAAEARRPALHAYVTQQVRDHHWFALRRATEFREMTGALTA
jgi:hypothetical protein